jgi:hypothetical protein
LTFLDNLAISSCKRRKYFTTSDITDSLDGLVARTRVRQRAMIADSTKWGYWMDGLCDLTGTIFFMIAVIMICQRSLQLRRTVTFQILPIFYYILAPFKRKISKISLPPDSDLDTEAFLSTVGTFLIWFWKISWVKKVF